MKKCVHHTRDDAVFRAAHGDWIGVDLNTTGYTAVVAHPPSGGVVMLGERPERGCADLPGRCSSASKRKKIRKLRDRELTLRIDRNQKIAGEIVKMARQLRCGIKLEDLSGSRFAGRKKQSASPEFSRGEGSFHHLQKLVEDRAHDAGIRVIYVNPAFTSQCCSRCGAPGIRRRKEFLCPHCGHAGHADANAAFNIASAPPGSGA